MTDIQSLLELQGLDMRRQELERALRGLPIQKEIDELEGALATRRASLADMNARLARLRKEQKEREWTIKETSASMDAISKKLYGGLVTNPREIEGMQGKLGMLQASKTRLEDQVLGYMEEIELLESEAKAVGARVAESAARLEELKKVRDAEVERLTSELAGVTRERDTLASTMPGVLLAKYEQLLKDRGGIAVVPVRGSTCGGCHVVLPTFLVTLAKPNNAVVRCENCGRILCWVG